MKTTPKLIYASELLNLLIPERELETINGICFRLESPGQLTAVAVLKTDDNEEYLQGNSRMIGFAMERRWKW